MTVNLRDGRELAGTLVHAWQAPDQKRVVLRVGRPGMWAELTFAATDVMHWRLGLPESVKAQKDLSAQIAAVHDASVGAGSVYSGDEKW